MSGKPCDKPFEGPVSLRCPHTKTALHHFWSQAIVFDNEYEALDAIMSQQVKEGHVLVIRYEGPKGRYFCVVCVKVTYNLLIYNSV